MYLRTCENIAQIMVLVLITLPYALCMQQFAAGSTATPGTSCDSVISMIMPGCALDEKALAPSAMRIASKTSVHRIILL